MSRSPILATLLCLGLFSGLAFSQQGSQRDPAWKAIAVPKPVTAPATAKSGPAPAQTTQAVPAQSPQRTQAAKSSGAAAKTAPTAKNAKSKGKKGKATVEQAVLPPPPPPKPEQLPPTRPTVTYRNGQLSILANNSTMADVLNSVRTQTGAQFDMSGVSSSDRVYAKLGPGAPKDVLAALLDGSRFNFAILGSPTDPTAVAHVVLMPKAGGPTTSTTTVAQNPVQRQVAPPDDEAGDEEGQPEEAPAEEPQVEQQQPQQPQEQQQEQQQQQPGQVKTPEQLLQELQQMQQQQQQQQQQIQQQQQQNPNGQQPPPQIPDREIPDDQPPQ